MAVSVVFEPYHDELPLSLEGFSLAIGLIKLGNTPMEHVAAAILKLPRDVVP